MRKLILAIALLLPAPVFAVMDKPTELVPYIKAGKPYGDGFYKWAFIKAYETSLWTDEHPWSMQGRFALSIRYNMHFTPQDLAQRSVDEIKHLGPLTADQEKDYLAQLMQIFPDVKSGDVITALHQPSKGISFFHNTKPVGTITDATFAGKFMGIWLDEKTSAPDLRKALLSSD